LKILSENIKIDKIELLYRATDTNFSSEWF